ncbi:hypothetical protein E2C01_037429 [Portunus trituberculatus]|uniref:Uncharacterized protein n=1 Tax=Portunus trituberculatus TaxID=210409 RepID=A0A5B7FFL3_PORTR|nr:hypothetical protein [Portunus trituberculatus]
MQHRSPACATPAWRVCEACQAEDTLSLTSVSQCLRGSLHSSAVPRSVAATPSSCSSSRRLDLAPGIGSGEGLETS